MITLAVLRIVSDQAGNPSMYSVFVRFNLYVSFVTYYRLGTITCGFPIHVFFV